MNKILALVERWGNRLPHPFWLFCYLILAVLALSFVLERAQVAVTTPETQLLKCKRDSGVFEDGCELSITDESSELVVKKPSAVHASRLSNLHVEIYQGEQLVAERAIKREELKELHIDQRSFPQLQREQTYRVHVVNRAEEVVARSLISRDGLQWFVLSMVSNFAHFEPLGLVLVMLMGVAIAEGAGLIPTVMRRIALSVPRSLIVPVLFALGACGNIGSDAGIVVIPPLAAAIFKQLGRNPIVGLLVGYVGATAGFTANILPAGTDVLAMSLTNAATGSDPEINVFANWYFMVVSVAFLALLGTWVNARFVEPRFRDGHGTTKDTSKKHASDEPSGGQTGASVPPEVQRSCELPSLSQVEKKALWWSCGAIALTVGLWMVTIIPSDGLLRHPDPDPALVWRSPFFKGLIPILFSIFAVGGVVYGIVARTIKRADDVIGFMSDSMTRMAGYIVLILVISQFIEMFQFARLDQIIAIEGAHLLSAMGMESLPIPFFVAFIVIIALANLFMGSASAKWAIFAPIFVPMFMTLGFHPAFTQLLYRIGDSITNCVSPLYPYFPILLGWIAGMDKERAKVGTVVSYLLPYATYLLIGWVLLLILWYLLGLPVGPDSPIYLVDM